MNKKAQRKILLEQRAGLEQATVAEWSLEAQKRLLADPVWQVARQVVLYVPIRNEVDTSLLLERAWREGKRVLLPRVNPECRGEMCLAACRGAHELVRGTFGVREPDPECCPPVRVDDPDFSPDLAVIPGVGFDVAGNRLGFGAGYYDKYLSHPAMQRTRFVGLTYGFQILPALPADPWDIRMHALCHEKELLWL